MPNRPTGEWRSLCDQPVLRARRLPDGEFTAWNHRGWDGQVLALEWAGEGAGPEFAPGDAMEIESERAGCLGEATECEGRKVFVFVELVVHREEAARIQAHWNTRH